MINEKQKNSHDGYLHPLRKSRYRHRPITIARLMIATLATALLLSLTLALTTCVAHADSNSLDAGWSMNLGVMVVKGRVHLAWKRGYVPSYVEFGVTSR